MRGKQESVPAPRVPRQEIRFASYSGGQSLLRWLLPPIDTTPRHPIGTFQFSPDLPIYLLAPLTLCRFFHLLRLTAAGL